MSRVGWQWMLLAVSLASGCHRIIPFERSDHGDVSELPDGPLVPEASLQDSLGEGFADGRVSSTDLTYLPEQPAELRPEDGRPGDLFGYRVALFGSRALVGSPFHDIQNANDAGAAYLFERKGPQKPWEPVKKFALDAPAAEDQLGKAVALASGLAVIGVPNDDEMGTDAGAVYVFAEQPGPTWSRAKLLASDGQAADHFGNAVAVRGNRVLVGASYTDEPGESGSVYLFEYDAGDEAWHEIAKHQAPDAAQQDFFGASVALGDMLILGGAPYAEETPEVRDCGKAYLFREQTPGESWTNETLLAPVPVKGAFFGNSVALSGSLAVVGSPQDTHDGGNDAGAVFIFGAGPMADRLISPESASGNQFGHAVAATTDHLMVGEPYSDLPGVENPGRGHLYRKNAGQWQRATPLSPLSPTPLGRMGFSVAVSETHALLGAPGEENGDTDTGAAYIFPLSF